MRSCATTKTKQMLASSMKKAGFAVAYNGVAALLLLTMKPYFELCKPRVVALMLLTAIVGMLLASPPGIIPLYALVFGTLGIGLSACSAAVINHLADQRVDKVMARTAQRPLPTGKVTTLKAAYFALILGVSGLLILVLFVNWLTAILTLITLIGYAGVYTFYLKYATPQNIVIGGASGAAPPLLGWTAVTGSLSLEALLLVLIIFIWTLPHFWALAIARQQDYAKANIPMLPVTHGVQYTKVTILFYVLVLAICTTLPYVTGISGLFYLVISLFLNAGFLYWAIKLLKTDNLNVAMKTFRFSILYLTILFIALLVDHYL